MRMKHRKPKVTRGYVAYNCKGRMVGVLCGTRKGAWSQAAWDVAHSKRRSAMYSPEDPDDAVKRGYFTRRVRIVPC